MSTKHTQSSFQRKAATTAYVLFFIGVALAALGQYALAGTALQGPLVVIGVAIVALSLIPAIIAYPWILGF